MYYVCRRLITFRVNVRWLFLFLVSLVSINRHRQHLRVAVETLHEVAVVSGNGVSLLDTYGTHDSNAVVCSSSADVGVVFGCSRRYQYIVRSYKQIVQ